MTKEEKKEYNKRYRQEHRTEIKDYKHKYAKEHTAQKSEMDRRYRIKHREELAQKKRESALRNSAHIAKYKRQYYLSHKKEIRDYKRNRYNANLERERGRSRKYIEENREMVNKKRMEYNRTHPQSRIAHNLRTRISAVLSCRSKGGRLHLLVGCSMDFLKQHLENQFEPTMSWSNYGRGVGFWSVDHIVPLDFFDLEDEEQQKGAFHWTNMKPMWYSENSSKSNRYSEMIL
jgi:hypothetical protein